MNCLLFSILIKFIFDYNNKLQYGFISNIWLWICKLNNGKIEYIFCNKIADYLK